MCCPTLNSVTFTFITIIFYFILYIISYGSSSQIHFIDYLEKKKEYSTWLSAAVLLTRIKKELFEDDTISIDSILTISSISTMSSYPSSESLSSIFHVHDVEIPLKERAPSVNGMENFKPALDNAGKDIGFISPKMKPTVFR